MIGHLNNKTHSSSQGTESIMVSCLNNTQLSFQGTEVCNSRSCYSAWQHPNVVNISVKDPPLYIGLDTQYSLFNFDLCCLVTTHNTQ